jgi:adenosylhomocysteine nucleosidase
VQTVAKVSESWMGDGPLTVVVAAMEEEMAPLRARLVGARRIDVGGAHVTRGRLGSASVALVVTGDGERNARLGLAASLAALPASTIIAIGVAGGLSASLGTGALVLGERVVAEADGRVHDADRALVEVAAKACGARRGVAVTAGHIADTAAEKRRLLSFASAHAAPGAGELAAVVDLESSAFAVVAARVGVPWLVLRAVSDTADEPVPALLNRSRDEGGAVRRGRVVRGLLSNPTVLGALLALRGRVRTCAEALAQAVTVTVAAQAVRGSMRAVAPVDPLASRIVESTAPGKEV